ncbi:MAG: anthranilate synthase component I family protein [Thermoanaerobaculia bacterium]
MDAREFESLRSQYDVIPFVRVFSADTITPVAAFAAASAGDSEAFLFESVERGENVGRYSFLGFEPRRTLVFSRGAADPIARLREELVPLRVHHEESLPPFFGGAVGYFGYGVARWSETLPDRHADADALPDAKILFFDRVIAFDHVAQKLYVVVNVFTASPRNSAELVNEAQAQLDATVSRLRGAAPGSSRGAQRAHDTPEFGHELLDLEIDSNPMEFTSSCTRESFIDMVDRAKEQIAAGEIFQCVVSQRWSASYPTDEALTLYRVLRSLNPSPYMFLLRTNECTVVGASPEMLVRVHGDRVETRPIAGTRPRGKSEDEDRRLEAELLADPKERAEHLMLVDLGRNDLGRIARRGSVEVRDFCRVERYSHVMHLVTDVHATLREGVTPIEAFLAAFPAGTVSGAPKIRAMELIDEFEPQRRGIYAGAIAYIGFSGNLDSCIAIRTMVLENDRAHVQAGAGIVFDSVPEREFEEAASKSAALRLAVTRARAVLMSRPDPVEELA